MNRQQKYPDTNTFYYYNANPKNKIGADCVIRAIATALVQSWEQTVRELTEVGIKYGYVLNDKKCYERYLKSKGWIKHKQPKKDDNTKYTGQEFCDYLYNYSDECYIPYIQGNVIAHIGTGHIVAFVEEKRQKYRCYDIWDSTRGCIGNYWTYEGNNNE